MPTKRRAHRWLALLPPLVMLGGIPVVNRATPLVLGLPPLLAWMIGCILLTSGIMGLIYALDRGSEARKS
jgi:hypothetical protein